MSTSSLSPIPITKPRPMPASYGESGSVQISLSFMVEGQSLRVKADGIWSITNYTEEDVAYIDQQEKEILNLINSKRFTSIVLEIGDIKKWDSILLSLYSKFLFVASEQKLSNNTATLPENFMNLLLQDDRHPHEHKEKEPFSPLLYAQHLWTKTAHVISFIGEVTMSLFHLFRGKAVFSGKDMLAEFINCSLAALPLISAICLLLGFILAFVTAYQLSLFGAEPYMASLLVISITRVLGPSAIAIILAGRTGAAYAALIGSMQVNEEIDSLATFGISPVDFLVLPRVLALSLMIPFLTMYGNVMAILAGIMVGSLMGISPTIFYENVLMFASLDSVLIGLLSSFIFGIIVSMAGCYQGLYCDRSADAVGKATTSAVVNAIVGVIIANAILTLIFTIK